MYKDKKVLAVIPARGGSKRIINKNIKEFCGKPLIAWTIEAAQSSIYIDRVILSSENTDIIDTSKKLGCDVPFVRPKELALDDTPGEEPILHAVDCISGYDYVVLLQPTSPLRLTVDIDESIKKCIDANEVSLVSVTEATQSPYWMFDMKEGDYLEKFINGRHYSRSQDLPKVYFLNGAVYVVAIDWFKENKSLRSNHALSYIMPESRSIDIDTDLDFIIAEVIKKNLDGK